MRPYPSARPLLILLDPPLCPNPSFFPVPLCLRRPSSALAVDSSSPVSRGSIPHVGSIFSFSSLDSLPYPPSSFTVQSPRRATPPAAAPLRRAAASSPFLAVCRRDELRLAMEHPVRASFGPLRPCSATGTRPCRRCTMVAASKSSHGRSGSLERTVRQ